MVKAARLDEAIVASGIGGGPRLGLGTPGNWAVQAVN
jgi:hypothetical protein